MSLLLVLSLQPRCFFCIASSNYEVSQISPDLMEGPTHQKMSYDL